MKKIIHLQKKRFFLRDVHKIFHEKTKKEIKPVDYCLKGRDLQVIIKLSNIELSSNNLHSKVFEGGKWHLEGLNEDIVATGIYYYQFENISRSDLSFRQAVYGDNSEIDHGTGDVNNYFGKDPWEDEKLLMFEHKTNFHHGDKLSEELGSITIQEDRCIVFPNYYQHKVDNFTLNDDEHPGKR